MSDRDRQTAAYGVTQLGFTYGSRSDDDHHRSRWAVNDLSFDVHEGEVLGIIGPNGSGKTSVLKLLAKILRPCTGSIQLFGRPLGPMRQETIAQMVALVPQDHQQIFPFTIFETVLMGRFPHRRPGGFAAIRWETEEDLELAWQAMQDMDVAHLATRSIQEVSGGERQRAVIARALTQQPRVLLLDEPTAFLDLNHQLDICRILRRLNETRELTVVLVSHDLNLASQYCDRVMLMEHGRTFQLGAPQEVIRPDLLQAVYRCQVLVDSHPVTGLPRVTLPGREQGIIDR